MPEHEPVITGFLNRLVSAVSRSAFLKTTVSRTGRLLDCSRLVIVEEGLPANLLECIVSSQRVVTIDLQLRSMYPTDNVDENDASDEKAPEARYREHRNLYDMLDRRIQRFAELLKRETGVHSLWLGHPFLHIVTGDHETSRSILAPVFLWPVSLRLDLRHEGRIRIQRDSAAGSAKFNRAMARWISREMSIELDLPKENELDELGMADIRAATHQICSQFASVIQPTADLGTTLERLPSVRLINPSERTRLYNSAVLGIYRWQNEAIIADLEALKNMQEVSGVASAFVSGKLLPRADQVDRPPESDRFQVYDADFSQERVIWQARNKPGLVMHGPPGTGKSLTIVNVIADALAHGKTVLMVCQKYAATRVVFEKLKQSGLDDLCLEVPDGEKCRTSVFKAIRGQVEMLPTSAPLTNIDMRRSALANEITALENELDNYAKALHERQTRIGISYQEMKTIEGKIYAEFPTVRPLQALHQNVVNLTALELDSVCREVEQIGRLFKLSDPMRNPWRHHHPTLRYTVGLKPDLDLAVEKLRWLDDQHSRKSVGNRRQNIEISEDTASFLEAAHRVLQKFRDVLVSPDSLRTRTLRAWLEHLQPSTDRETLSYRARGQKAVTLAHEVASTPLSEAIRKTCAGKSDYDLKRIFGEAEVALGYQDRWWRFLSPVFQSVKREQQNLSQVSTDSALWTLSKELLKYKDAQELRANLMACNRSLVPGLEPPSDEETQVTFPEMALEELAWAERLRHDEDRHACLSQLLDTFVWQKKTSELRGMIESLSQTLQRLPEAEELIGTLDRLSVYLKPKGLSEPKQMVRSGHSIGPWLDHLISGLSGLEPLITYTARRSRCGETTAPIVESLEDYESARLRGTIALDSPENLPAESYGAWWVALVKFTANLSWQAECEKRTPALLEITPEIHARKAAELKQELKEKRKLETEAIKRKWLPKQVEHRDKPWKRWFQLRAGRNTKAKRLREAVELSLNDGLLAMRPCWLMNPATVAEVFPLLADMFDVVIFDEASQCPVEQAVPSIYRGKVVVVSGDEKQLPPTSFFQSRWSDEDFVDDSEEQEATDDTISPDKVLERLGVEHLLQVEDLLSAAIGNMPERYLSVHYRSIHPALIEFSNRAFYNGRLEAPPARTSAANGSTPIRYFQVNGLYDQRTNPEEAQCVVNTLRQFWELNGQTPTIGVVTFNQPQRDLIEDLLAQECGKDRAFEARYREQMSREEANQDVGLFVKNLENVQGDERDVMIFSTTFGKDKTGQFWRRFGPIGAAGGERRLNVAVTRAKQQVIVVSSMPIDSISTALAVTGAPGGRLTPACYLQLYLAYAKAISEHDEERRRQILDRLCHSDPDSPTGTPESPFEEDVCRVLEKLGYHVDCQIGDSGFRIDLGVVAADPRHGYLLGIECDGATYHSDRSARLRDVWRANILRERGWQLHRIWSTRWWYYRGEEIDKLKAALESAESAFEWQLKTTPVTDKNLMAGLTHDSNEEASPEVRGIPEEQREPWQMTLAAWKRLRDELRARDDQQGLRDIGGLTGDHAHRYQVRRAVQQGMPVPSEVLDDYPELHAADG